MEHHFDNIARELQDAKASIEDRAAYLEFLDRVIHEARGVQQLERITQFGAQFKAGGEPAEPPAERQFEPFDIVRTKEDYIGYVAHYNKRGHVVVNVVVEACDYKEGDLRKIDP